MRHSKQEAWRQCFTVRYLFRLVLGIVSHPIRGLVAVFYCQAFVLFCLGYRLTSTKRFGGSVLLSGNCSVLSWVSSHIQRKRFGGSVLLSSICSICLGYRLTSSRSSWLLGDVTCVFLCFSIYSYIQINYCRARVNWMQMIVRC